MGLDFIAEEVPPPPPPPVLEDPVGLAILTPGRKLHTRMTTKSPGFNPVLFIVEGVAAVVAVVVGLLFVSSGFSI